MPRGPSPASNQKRADPDCAGTEVPDRGGESDGPLTS